MTCVIKKPTWTSGALESVIPDPAAQLAQFEVTTQATHIALNLSTYPTNP